MENKLTNKDWELLGRIVIDLEKIINDLCCNENLYDAKVTGDLNSAWHTLRTRYLSADVFN